MLSMRAHLPLFKMTGVVSAVMHEASQGDKWSKVFMFTVWIGSESHFVFVVFLHFMH